MAVVVRMRRMKSRRGQCVHPRYGERGIVLGRIAAACSQARRALNSKGFDVIKKGSAVYKKARAMKKRMKTKKVRHTQV